MPYPTLYFIRKRSYSFIAAAGACLALAVLPLLFAARGPEAGVTSPDHRARIESVLDDQLAWAKSAGVSDTSERLSRLVQFFDEAKRGTDGFAEDVLGWSSKWAIAKDAVTGDSSHAAVVQELFAKHLFRPGDLEQYLEQAVAEFIRHVDDVDAQFLVRLQADLAGFDSHSLPTTFSIETIEARLTRASEEVSQAVMADLRGAIGREIGSLVAGQILTQAATQLATSAGIIGAGASSGAMTFGAGLIVGVAVDFIFSWTYEAVYHPSQEISNKMWSELDQLSRLIIYGNETEPGFMGWMFRYHEQRVQARAQAMQSLLNQ